MFARWQRLLWCSGFDIKEGVHAIVPVMLYDAKLSQVMSDKLLAEGIYVIGFFVASFADTTIIWNVSLITIALMTVPNLIGLIWLRKEVKSTIKDYWINFKNEFPNEDTPE